MTISRRTALTFAAVAGSTTVTAARADAAQPPGFRSDFTSNKLGWTPVRGTWSVGGGALHTTGVVGGAASIAHGGTYDNVLLTARIRRLEPAESSRPQGVFLQGNPTRPAANGLWSPSYLFAYTNSGMAGIFRVGRHGGLTPLVDWVEDDAIESRRWNDVQVVCASTYLSIRVNGGPFHAVADDALTSGRIGLVMVAGTSSPLDVDFVDVTALG